MIRVSSTAITAAPEVIIVGASARAAAFSALRSGLTPICIDRFGDADLQRVATVTRVDDYPGGIASALGQLRERPALYVGGIENNASLVRQLAARGPLFGNSVDVLSRVRDPFRIAREFQKPRFPCLEVRPVDAPPPRDGQWLMKPIGGTGGRGITVWSENAQLLDEPLYFQKRQAGTSYSAVFIGPPDTRDVRFVGITRQFAGEELLAAPAFAWCGSIGPITLGVAAEHQIRRLGNFLSWRFGLCGLFGIDFILDEADVPWITDINPRYPASAEVLEHICGLTLVGDHCRVFSDEWPTLRESPPEPVAAMGKFVLYARSDVRAPDPNAWLNGDLQDGELWSRTPRIADVPPAGTLVTHGTPLCTLFTTGDNPNDCLEQLPDVIRHTESLLNS